MADDFKNGDVPGDCSCISMKQEHEVRYWTERLGCSKDELAAAIKKAIPLMRYGASLVDLGDTDGSDQLAIKTTDPSAGATGRGRPASGPAPCGIVSPFRRLLLLLQAVSVHGARGQGDRSACRAIHRGRVLSRPAARGPRLPRLLRHHHRHRSGLAAASRCP